MTPTITVFERSPDRGRGVARDMRVRWALEELGLPYNVRLVEEHPNIAAYVAHGEARPAYQRAFESQLAAFNRAAG